MKQPWNLDQKLIQLQQPHRQHQKPISGRIHKTNQPNRPVPRHPAGTNRTNHQNAQETLEGYF